MFESYDHLQFLHKSVSFLSYELSYASQGGMIGGEFHVYKTRFLEELVRCTLVGYGNGNNYYMVNCA